MKSVRLRISIPSVRAFLNEMIELIGATNIFADQDGWIPVSAEQVVAANPDVIITNADYMEGAVAEIEAREGAGRRLPP